MIDHISVAVNNFEQSLAFYDQTLKILGYDRLMTFEDEDHQVAGYGKDGKTSFWMGVDRTNAQADEIVGRAKGFHVGFIAPDIDSVQKWYETCLTLGATDNGAPGPRPEYHPGYYGGFVIDPNGWRIEACIQNYDGKL